MTVAVGIFAHQEERRIAMCLSSLRLDRADTVFHILVNGTTDDTVTRARAAVAGRPNIVIHDISEGGKSRTWNHFIHDILTGREDAVILMDGDAQILPGSFDALIGALSDNPGANAAAGMPHNGRNAAAYRAEMIENGGLFGDLYALAGGFVAAIRARGLRLPDDLIGDDGLVASWAYNDLGIDGDFRQSRVVACQGAGFLAEQVSPIRPATWRMQYRRMINYSVRYFQNRIIADIMTREGPTGLPRRLALLYDEWLPRLRPRPGITGHFDRKALDRMRRSA